MDKTQRKSLSLIIVVLLISILGGFFIYPGNGVSDNLRPWHLGLDLVGGAHLVYEVDMSDVDSADQAYVLSGLRDVVEGRVNAFGVSEPQVLTAEAGDSKRIIVELAGIKDISAAIQRIGQTPNLVFAEVSDELPTQEATVDENGKVDLQASIADALQQKFKDTKLTGRYVESAQLGFDNISGQPLVYLQFNDEGAALFEEITSRNVGKPLAIILDDRLVNSPTVQQTISGGQAQVTGLGSINEARTLVEQLNAGALPAPITLISQQTVGASLGADSLQSIIWAGLIGALLVILFMLIYYRKLGIFASIALIIYIVLLLGLFKLFFTLTLAGIAGIVLSIGMAIDANILIFERTKEEIKSGSPQSVAISEGFKRAWPSIRDSNITTIITSLVLYNLTSSFIRGFALSLLLGVLVSMFTAITITRSLLTVFYRKRA
ncbi:MAG: protein translocase subunit SecD [Candidatus Harrisonbacteria bacterium CG10_big_fil_rev_8_21_14_0_10_44_23]|uniref:Protein translocase subunit SecD n=1 Tax=Candidatus Harrisonbacteria bacterium CG10_big_fil_rev_8_21_14_0_10_44_23 TaxID=1974585 RepID=A0A2H0US10_9BACT|nr:MAG: protein translocase subunit SecD [Candidatus Harrisonbacteria bacterium CG10_big_fil_rev_8_21_14_0_10_44_23]